MLAGVDGYRHGWIAAAVADDGNRTTEVRSYPSFAALLADSELTTIVIDIPIGLPDRGPRACDIQARRFLGPRRGGSIFPAPIRAVLGARSHAEACEIGARRDGRRCSMQLWGLLAKIREVDQHMTDGLQSRIREGHPEVSFRLMNGDEPLHYGKNAPAGRDHRLRLLASHFADVNEHLSAVAGAASDIIDAYACLWTARRLVRNRNLCFPEHVERDMRGLKAAIVA